MGLIWIWYVQKFEYVPEDGWFFQQELDLTHPKNNSTSKHDVPVSKTQFNWQMGL
jgi:hypothetical protein